MQPPVTRYTAVSDGAPEIAYQVVGEGPFDLVLVPGFVSHLDLQWTDPGFARFLRRLASFSRLIVFDKRGCGMSDPATTMPSPQERLDDLRAVMDAAGSRRAALFGTSEGGGACLLFAAAHPERTTALVTFGAFARAVRSAD